MKITIYNHNDEKYNNQKNTTSFSILMQKEEQINKQYVLVKNRKKPIEQKREPIPSVSIGSDEYKKYNVHVFENIDYYLKIFEVEEVHIQSPPKILVDKLENNENEIEYSEFEFDDIKGKNIIEFKKNAKKKIFGQEYVIDSISITLNIKKISKNQRPLVIMLYGSPGVGKTELSKYIENYFYGKKLLRIQFSMFQHDKMVDYLFGGNFNGDSFSTDLLKRKSNMVLLDEFDKVNPIFYSAFFELFDEGFFTDRYYKVDMSNSIIILTSNFKNEKKIEEQIGSALYSRIDKCIKFNELNIDSKRKIFDLEFEYYDDVFEESEDYTNIKSHLFSKHIIISKNAREIKSTIDSYLSYKELEGEIKLKSKD